ncbi:hypothetical protein [Rheinheimera sp. MMS21-TC3]|uniref:hypothetical protein n=1 Tax=Rheinheimera sp. MMS21-TC3 TaxID=3072790 RepID=UPI0028C48E57|nr:hypothetical protein [Rheinheimera sp. MMS21-TC3]WNO60686.1 hypothetical protein RDV63_06900 [Rheinheimera sp. MMS21-TC3]
MTCLYKLKTILLLVVVFTSFSAFANRYNNSTCGIIPGQKLTNAYGPYDATNPAHASKLPIVLGAHFTRDVERLVSGISGPVMGDIDYTLRAIPNYHRALAAMAKYQRREKVKLKERDRYYTADCYFQRAIYFQPADATTRMLFAMHMHLTGRLNEAAEQYQLGIMVDPDYPEMLYNYGLLLFDLKRFTEAQQIATKAYAAGFPLQGLKDKLKNAGYSIESVN